MACSTYVGIVPEVIRKKERHRSDVVKYLGGDDENMGPNG